ncbi:hypothetical protein BST61_g9983 [Cercospora zeina]
MRTVEPSYEYYMRQYRYEGSNRECQWIGPVWPYQPTQVLYAMPHLLNTYNQSLITKSDYLDELRRYTRLHYWDNKLNLEEDYEPDKAGPIVGLARSPHCFHSGYNDLIISGLVGLRPRADNTLKVNPLIPEGSLPYFRLQDIPYHGHNIAIQWDANGRKDGQGTGLRVEVDNQVVATSRFPLEQSHSTDSQRSTACHQQKPNSPNPSNSCEAKILPDRRRAEMTRNLSTIRSFDPVGYDRLRVGYAADRP